MHAKSLQLYPTLCDPIDCSLQSSSVCEILQARILEWVAMPFSRGSSWPRDRTCISYASCIAGGFSTTSATWEAPKILHAQWSLCTTATELVHSRAWVPQLERSPRTTNREACAPQRKLSAATKTWHSQINKYGRLKKNLLNGWKDKLWTVGKYLLTTCPTTDNDLEYIKSSQNSTV